MQSTANSYTVLYTSLVHTYKSLKRVVKRLPLPVDEVGSSTNISHTLFINELLHVAIHIILNGNSIQN